VPDKPVISIIDDDRSVRDATADLVSAMGFVVEAFERADEFLNSDRRHSTSCVIADVRMPGMTGIELHAHLIELGKPIPTILVTAFPDDKDRARALAVGVVCYLAKPFREDELLVCIQLALEPQITEARES
jgi:FixJ family two-component response regulator